MTSRKMSIRLNPAERQVLETLYVATRIPVDRFQNRPAELGDLTESFNSLSGRSEIAEDVLHYMRTRRKNGSWPRLGKAAMKLRDDLDELVSPEEFAVLEGIYLGIGRAHGKGNDSFAHEPDLLRELEREFMKATGRYIHGGQLLAILTVLRKDSRLQRLSATTLAADEGFADLDEAASL